MIGIIIPVYNRPEYLQKCLDSLSQITTLPDDILFIDDGSTDISIHLMISDFCSRGVGGVIGNGDNIGVRASLKKGIERLFGYGCDIIINLDSDAIVKPDFIDKLISLRDQHPGHIVSGFNAISTVNPIIETYDNCCVKAYANGINMCFDKVQYEKYIKPALQKVGNWDYNTSLACREDNLPFYVTKPSVVQHIGLVSSMGHTQGGVKSDEAYDY